MPANLTPQYHSAEARYRAAVTSKEKLDALEEMLSVIPKHKGTEKIQADIKRRIAKLRERDKQSGGSKRGYELRVEREGAGQIVLVGPPNAGKSLLISRLTNAEPEVAEYPYCTRKPIPGMMEYEDIQIQLVDMPPIALDASEPSILAIVRSADAVLLFLDGSASEPFEDLEDAKEELLKAKVVLRSTEKESDEELGIGFVAKPAMIAVNKTDFQKAQDNYKIIQDLYSSEYPVLSVSALSGKGLADLKIALFELLSIVRVYTKAPGKSADFARPFTLPKGSTLLDLAANVHHDFAQKLKFARAWGGDKPDAVMIARDYVLQDKDIVELHT